MSGFAWTAGVLLGALDGFLLLEFPTLGLALLFVAALLAVRDRNRSAGIGGLLVGVGGCWTLLLARATLDCDAFNRVPNQGCTAIGVEPFLVASVLMLLVGIVLTVAATRTRRSPRA
jgi:hypothetical protein